MQVFTQLRYCAFLITSKSHLKSPNKRGLYCTFNFSYVSPRCSCHPTDSLEEVPPLGKWNVSQTVPVWNPSIGWSDSQSSAIMHKVYSISMRGRKISSFCFKAVIFKKSEYLLRTLSKPLLCVLESIYLTAQTQQN